MNSVNNASNPDVISIRAASISDLDRICELEQELFPDPWPRSAFEEQLEVAGWGTLVAEHDGEIIAYACYMMAANESHLTNIAVVPSWRRKSVARALLDRILEIVIAHTCDLILLEVRLSNAGARAFYERHGFKLLYRRKNYYRRPIEDALVMVRYLKPDEDSDH